MKKTSVLPRLLGVIHLPPLAGAPGTAGEDPAVSLQKAGLLAVKEAQALVKAGFQGLILENFGDTPFYKSEVPPETLASLAVIAAVVRESVRVPLGINVLRNDARAALAVAAVTGCQFIRVNVLSGVAATDQGMIEGQAAFLIRERARLAPGIKILADAHVKHAQTLSGQDIGLAIEELALRACADGVIVTGDTTGRPVLRETLVRAAKAAAQAGVPLYIGSGATAESLKELFEHAQGVIVGSTLRRGGQAGAPLDAKRIKTFIGSYRKIKRR